MRQIARYTDGGYGCAAPPGPGGYPADELRGSPAGDPGQDAKVDPVSLPPGGVTQDAGPGNSRFLHASSPEPVFGYGGMKGISAYYQAVLYFGTPME
jgi:hypothetical protein